LDLCTNLNRWFSIDLTSKQKTRKFKEEIFFFFKKKKNDGEEENMRHANPAILVQFELSPNFRISQTKNLIIEQHL
jgi:hypothetical protein